MKSRIKADVKGNGVSITCKKCGEPIVKSNEFGMYCKNECGVEEDKLAYEKIRNMFGNFFK